MRKIDMKEEISDEQKRKDVSWTQNMWGVLTGLLLFAAWAVAADWHGPFEWREFGSRLVVMFLLGCFVYVTGLVPWSMEIKEKGWVPRATVILGVLALHAWVMWNMIFSHAG